MRWLRTLPVPVALIVMIGLAGGVLGRVFADDLLTRLVVGAAVGSVAVSVAARRLRSWLVAPLSVAALAGFLALALRLTAERAELTGPLTDIAADSVGNGIPRLLTAMIPVEPTPDTVVVPLVSAWLAGLAGAEVALRTGRILLGYLPPAGLFVGALYVVGPNADPAIWQTVALVAVAALGLAVTGRRQERAADHTDDTSEVPPAVRAAIRLRALAGSAVALAVVVGLVAGLGPLIAGRVGVTPVDPRRYVQPPQVDTLDENPLIRISGWALEPEQELFTIRTSGAGGPADQPDAAASPDGDDPPAAGAGGGVRIRLAVLNDYTGVTWKVGATYRNAGRILPPGPPTPGATVETVRQEIDVTGLTGRLLPAVATPRQVTGARVAYDQASGTLIRPEGLAPGVRYTVTSARERPDLNLIAGANVPAGEAVARVLRVPAGAPEQMSRLAATLAEENGAPYARAVAVEQFLAEHYRLVADAPSGHAYPNLNFFLFGPRNGGGQRGTSEQFAAAFAILGRLMGLPTRVVVGFAPRAGTGPVRAGDAYAWPEVLFDGLGWVAFDPLPQPNTDPRPVEEDFKPKPEEPPPSPDEPSAAPSPSASASAPQAASPSRSDGGIPTPVLVGGSGGGVLLLLVAGLVTLALLRGRLRRHRLADGPPAQRVAGAWREVTDALRLAGHTVPDHLAATEVAVHAGVAVGTVRPPSPPGDAPAAGPDRWSAPAAELADLVNQAAFAPQTTTDAQARRAGELAVAYVSKLGTGRSRWRRLLWAVHPGPLRWRR